VIQVFFVLSGASSYSWTSNSTNLIISNSTNNQVVVIRQNDYNNYAAIPLTVQSVKCGVSNQVFTKEVYLGIPVIGNNTQNFEFGIFLHYLL